jgi:hypothetical protein
MPRGFLLTFLGRGRDILLGRTKFCQPGYGVAYGRRKDQDERFNRARAQEHQEDTGHREAPGIWWHASPVKLLIGESHGIGRTERAPSAALSGCVRACASAGLNLESEKPPPPPSLSASPSQ